MVITIRKVLFALIAIILMIVGLIYWYIEILGGITPPEYVNLKAKESLLSKDKDIDNEIQNLLESKSNSFENPLVIQDPFDKAPLTALVVFNTQSEVTIRMTILGDTEADTIENEFPKSLEHRIPIIGLYPDRQNKVIIEQIDQGQVIKSKELSIKTEPLPQKLTDIVEVTNSQEKAVDGITILSGGPFNTPYAFDSSGKIRWFLNVDTEGHGYFPLENGRFIVMTTDSMLSTGKRKYATRLYDMDFLGRLHDVYFIPKGAHHEVIEKTPNGNLLVLSNSLEDHVEDLVLEVDRKTGKVVKELNLGDMITGVYDETADWAHINSISYSSEDDSVILSVRNLSSAIKINWSTHELKWILSDPKLWEKTEYEEYVLKPIGSTVWHYEQHTVYQHKENLDNNPQTLDLLMFDNRVIRNELIDMKIDEDTHRSSVTQYSIDEKNKTVMQVKRFPNSLAYITSNYQLFYDEDRLIANHASLTTGDTFWGEIYEYQYSTGRLLRSYKTKYSFYRAYRQNFDFQSSSKPMN